MITPHRGQWRSRTWTLAAALAAGAWWIGATAAAGQVPADSIPDPAPRDTVVVVDRPWSPTATMTLAYPTGSANDPAGLEGSTWLLGRLLEDALNEAIEPLAARATVRVERLEVTVTLSASPDAVGDLWFAAESVLGTLDVADESFQAERSRLLDQLRFARGSPALEVDALVAGVLGNGDAAWARPVQGTVESVTRLTRADVLQVSEGLDPEARSVVVVTPVDRTAMPPWLADALWVRPPARSSAPQAAPIEPPTDAVTRSRIQRDVTNAWIAAVYPIDSGLDESEAELAALVLQDLLEPEPPDPGLYGVRGRVVETPTGRKLVLRLAVTPEATTYWEDAVLGRVRDIQAGQYPAVALRTVLWEARTQLLLAEARNEDLSRRLALDLRYGRPPVDRSTWLDRGPVDLEAITAAVRMLGPPTVLVYGPPLAGSSVP